MLFVRTCFSKLLCSHNLVSHGYRVCHNLCFVGFGVLTSCLGNFPELVLFTTKSRGNAARFCSLCVFLGLLCSHNFAFHRYGVCRNLCFVGLGVPTSLFSQCPDFPVFHHQNKGKCCPLFYFVFFENCFALITCFFTVMGFVQSFICLFGGSNKLVLAISLNSLV